MSTPDALAALAAHTGIAAACQGIQAALDQAAWDRGLLRAPEEFWTLIRRECAYASAELDGATAPADPASEPDDSPMGRIAAAALVVTAAADTHWRDFSRAPMQVWARLHTMVDDGPQRGRPRTADDAHDPLHLGGLPTAAQVNERLHALGQAIVHSAAPGVLVAAIAHAELAALRPFTSGSYLVARATPRMVLRARGCDTVGAASVEIGQLAIGRARYVRAVQAYASGTAAGIQEYLEAFGLWVHTGIQRTQAARVILNARN